MSRCIQFILYKFVIFTFLFCELIGCANIMAESLPDIPLVVIDAGHGGEEEGALGVTGAFEKDIVLAIARFLEEILKANLNVRTLLTRSSDINITLADRTAIANTNNATLFISIHANATSGKNARGIETYYLDNTNDKASSLLARRENQVIGGITDDLSFILSDLIQSAKQPDSISLAHYVQDALVFSLSSKYSDIVNLGVKKAPFHVLVGAHMPCILVEVSFIDHVVEGRRLATSEYQRTIAQALFNGIKEYFVKKGIVSSFTS